MKNLRYLSQFLENENHFRKFRKQSSLTLNNITEEIAEDLVESLYCSLSPENLTCDGELSKTEIKKRFQLFNGALKDLKSLGFDTREKY